MVGCFIDSRVQGRALGDNVEFKVHLPSGPWVSLQGELTKEDYPMGFELLFTRLTTGDKRLLAQVVLAHGGHPGKLQSSSQMLAIDAPRTASAGVTQEIATALDCSLAAEIDFSPWNIEMEVSSQRRRVLVADDDALTLRMVSAIVETEGYEVVSVANGRQALRSLQQDAPYTAAIFDMSMPHLQGLDVILYMKADERLRHVPVGMITAERDPKVWDNSVAAGVSVFLPKPFTPPQVQMMLSMLASKAGLR
jgi:CheY-like chemotaxis protein